MPSATIVEHEDGKAHVSIHQSGVIVPQVAEFPSYQDARLALLADGWREDGHNQFLWSPSAHTGLHFCDYERGARRHDIELHRFDDDEDAAYWLNADFHWTHDERFCVKTSIIRAPHEGGASVAADDPLIKLLSGGIVQDGAIGSWATLDGAETGIKQIMKQLEDTYGRIFLYEALRALVLGR